MHSQNMHPPESNGNSIHKVDLYPENKPTHSPTPPPVQPRPPPEGHPGSRNGINWFINISDMSYVHKHYHVAWRLSNPRELFIIAHEIHSEKKCFVTLVYRNWLRRHQRIPLKCYIYIILLIIKRKQLVLIENTQVEHN